MQVIRHAIALMFFPALSGSSTCASLVRALPSRGPAQLSTRGTWLDSTQDSTLQAMPLSQYLVLGTAWKASPSTTSIAPQAIKPPPPSASPCGLGSCSARVTTNPLHFIMQSLSSATLPNEWKVGKVVPVYKSDWNGLPHAIVATANPDAFIDAVKLHFSS
ncbi:uncharacterized protein LOC119406100 [Rhipicephalus sanguineus]|uniref:uncharacterized protein LOC119406100 n=1 Tax=Rhipicephalus sanguineus TaxID=34632 RepID=UPI0020C3A71A|nr:uncharacterized protein LOC119406100 [Rhipicephalus sanguineus]